MENHHQLWIPLFYLVPLVSIIRKSQWASVWNIEKPERKAYWLAQSNLKSNIFNRIDF